MKRTLGKRLHIPPEGIAVGNGSADLLYRIVLVLRPKRGLIFSPTFAEYAKTLHEAGSDLITLPADPERGFSVPWEKAVGRLRRGDVLFLCNPNNPTGTLIPRRIIEDNLSKIQEKGAFLIVDEAFIDLMEDESLVSLAVREKNLLILRSLTKFYGLAGLRLGYTVGPPEWIKRIEEFGQPWPVNVLAQAAGEALLKDDSFREKTLSRWRKEKDFLYRGLQRLAGIQVFPSSAPFFLVRLQGNGTIEQLRRHLWREGLLIRDGRGFSGLESGYFRVAVRSRKENRFFLQALKKALE